MNKQEAAKQRIEYALDKICTAQEFLDKSLQALSSVIGVSRVHKTLQKISRDVKGAFYDLRDLRGDALKLDREPDEKQEKHYCITAPIAELLAEQLMVTWTKTVHPDKTPPKWSGDGTDHKSGLPVPDEVKNLWRALAGIAIETLSETP